MGKGPIEIGNHKLYQGDCLGILPLLEDSSVHCIIADLPYGTTYCSWDSIIPLDKLWEQYNRLIIGNGAMIFTNSARQAKLIYQETE